MEEKLLGLYKECVEELKTIGIELENNEEIGEIYIKLAARKCKRYGCCKQEEPDKKDFQKIKRKNRNVIIYNKFKKHHIEISKWVMELDKNIIKNTIMHEIIHCFPGCNNHGKNFKKYAKLINENLGYSIKTLGNKKEDFEKSNLVFEEKNEYKYKIICEKCGQVFYRKRLKKDLIKKYRCSKCNGKIILT